MQLFDMDSSGWLLKLNSLSSSHHARHMPSRRAFIGGAAAAATGATLGSGLLWPAAGAAAARTNRAPKPTTNAVTIGGVTFHLTSFGRTYYARSYHHYRQLYPDVEAPEPSKENEVSNPAPLD